MRDPCEDVNCCEYVSIGLLRTVILFEDVMSHVVVPYFSVGHVSL